MPVVLPTKMGTPLFATQEGQVLRYCEDCQRQADSKRLLWVDCLLPVAGALSFVLYSMPERNSAFEATVWETQTQFSLAEDIFILADYFRQEKLVHWEGCLRPAAGTDFKWMPAQDLAPVYRENCPCRAAALSTIDAAASPGGRGVRGEGAMMNLGPHAPQVGRALNLRGPEGATVLRRQFDLGAFSPGKLHIRANFFDEGTRLAPDEQHYLQLLCRYGNPCVGLLPGISGYCGPAMTTPAKWTRTRGWHLFELTRDIAGKWVALVDGKTMGETPLLEATEGDVAEIRVVAYGASRSAWASIEVIGMPAVEGLWPPTTCRLMSGQEDLLPWLVASPQEGRWGVVETTVQSLVEEPPEVEQEDDLQEEDDEEDEVEEEEAIPVVPSVPKAKKKGKGKHRPKATKDPSMFTIECWSLGSPETDVERLDRVMNVFVERLIEAGVVLPENLQRIKECGEPLHPGCFIYSFGTRRVHIAVREGDSGRLALVVRCGGGFLDFAEFARRHGSLEQLRFQRRPESGGRQLVQLSSVLAGRCVRVREMPTAEN